MLSSAKRHSVFSRQHSTSVPAVIFFSDPFAHYIEPQVEQAALDVLDLAGFDAQVLPVIGAGASLLSEHMIAMGDSGGSPRRRLVHLAKGLGLAPDVIIDQHFRRRDRLGRLLTALSYNPAPLGLGVDEDTAAVIDPDGTMTVLGAGAVTVVDASRMRYTDSYAATRGQPLALLGLRLDFLTTGCRYDLKNRVGIVPPPMVHLDPIDRRAPERPPVLTELQPAAVAEDGGE